MAIGLEPDVPFLAPSVVAPASDSWNATRPPGRPLPGRKTTGSAVRRIGLAPAVAMVAIILGTTALVKRETMTRAAPFLAKTYAMIGLPVNLDGFEFRNVRTRVVTEADQRFLVVEGEIRNARPISHRLPDVQISLRDGAGQEVYTWRASAEKTDLDRSGTTAFRARLIAPPEAAETVRVRFAGGA